MYFEEQQNQSAQTAVAVAAPNTQTAASTKTNTNQSTTTSANTNTSLREAGGLQLFDIDNGSSKSSNTVANKQTNAKQQTAQTADNQSVVAQKTTNTAQSAAQNTNPQPAANNQNRQAFSLEEDIETPGEAIDIYNIYTLKTNKDEVYYKIQLGTFKQNNANVDNIKEFGTIEITDSYGQYIYRIGNYFSKDEALDKLEKIRYSGYNLAFILQYKNDQIVGIIK
jgi:hypothetical protein